MPWAGSCSVIFSPCAKIIVPFLCWVFTHLLHFYIIQLWAVHASHVLVVVFLLFHLEHFCPPTVYISYDISSFINKLFWHVTFNKLRTPVWGHTEIPGGECHRLKIWDMELMRWFVHSCRKQSVGMLVGVQVNWHGSPVHVQCFSHQKREADDCDITNVILMHRVWEYIRRACMSLGAIVWVFGAEHSGNFLRSHQCFVTATSVPLMEWQYIPTGKCSLFIHLHVPKVILGTIS